MGFGAFHPYPRRFGGGKTHLEIRQEGLTVQRGTAYSNDPTSIVWLANHAIARALVFDGWDVNGRLALQWDPDRMTDMLPRWEKIFRIIPAPTATLVDRHAVIKARFRRFLDATGLNTRITNALSVALGPFFVAVEYLSLTVANVHDDSGTFGTPLTGAPWTSTVAHILVRLTKPAGYSEGEFYAAAGLVTPLIDPIMPAWCTLDWYRAPVVYAPVVVIGGPSGGGFYLDEPSNLDNSVFDA